MVSAALSLPSQGKFSSFSRLTDSLSVVKEYLALEGGPPVFTPGFTSPTLLECSAATSVYRAITFFGHAFQRVRQAHGCPFSLAATNGVAVAFLSSGYLDVSVPQVCLARLCIQRAMPLRAGCPIRKPRDHCLVTGSLGHIAGSHVLHRLLTPRHPPFALDRLISSTSRPPLRTPESPPSRSVGRSDKRQQRECASQSTRSVSLGVTAQAHHPTPKRTNRDSR